MNLRLLAFGAIAALVAVPAVVLGSRPAEASHAWGTYHWARTGNPFSLKLGDNVNSTWDPSLVTASGDWTGSTVLNTSIVAGGTLSNTKRCRATSGRVEVCNSSYGNTGWLGVASIWASGSHITQGTVKVNDYYYSSSYAGGFYNNSDWRLYVMCQEVGHTFGLDHQDTDFYNANLGSCMDYTDDPARDNGYGNNEHPGPAEPTSRHTDFDELDSIYSHTDSSATVGAAVLSGPGRSGSAADEGPNDPADFGRPTGSKDGLGRNDLFVKDLPDGRKLFTHVFWELSSSGRGNSGR